MVSWQRWTLFSILFSKWRRCTLLSFSFSSNIRGHWFSEITTSLGRKFRNTFLLHNPSVAHLLSVFPTQRIVLSSFSTHTHSLTLLFSFTHSKSRRAENGERTNEIEPATTIDGKRRRSEPKTPQSTLEAITELLAARCVAVQARRTLGLISASLYVPALGRMREERGERKVDSGERARRQCCRICWRGFERVISTISWSQMKFQESGCWIKKVDPRCFVMGCRSLVSLGCGSFLDLSWRICTVDDSLLLTSLGASLTSRWQHWFLGEGFSPLASWSYLDLPDTLYQSRFVASSMLKVKL